MISPREAMLVLVAPLVAGCAPAALSPAGARIQIVATSGPACALVTPLRGSAGYNGRSGETNAADVEIYLRNQAAERGADTLVITGRREGATFDGDTLSQPRGASSTGGCPNCITVTADAFRCVAPAAAPIARAVAVVAAPAARADASDPPFAERAAEAAMSAAMSSARTCRKTGDPAGEARVSVTFAPTGDVVYAEVMGGPFGSSPTGECVAHKFRNARIPAFAGGARSITATVQLGD